MNKIIETKIVKFKSGDFSGYENFYNETVQTVYTMLHSIVANEQEVLSIIPKVYDKIYQNINKLMHIDCFYQWTAEFVNEEALLYLKEHGQAELSILEDEITEQIYDYAAEDVSMTITEDVVTNPVFTTKLQDILNTFSPIEKIVIQDYYYFGNGIQEIVTKTGIKSTDIKCMLSRTRTMILQVIGETCVGNNKTEVRTYRLSDVPWMWIAYQNFLGYTLGMETIGIHGAVLGMAGQAAMNAAAGGAASQAGCAAGNIATSAGVGSMESMQVAGSTVATSGGIATGFFGTIGGRIAIAVIGVAAAIAIGFGVHHVVTENDKVSEEIAQETTLDTVESTAEQTTEETAFETTEQTIEVTTVETAEQTTEEITEEPQIDYSLYDSVIEERKSYIESSEIYQKENERYAIFDFDGDGIKELLFGMYSDYEVEGVILSQMYTIVDGNAKCIYRAEDYEYGFSHSCCENGYVSTSGWASDGIFVCEAFLKVTSGGSDFVEGYASLCKENGTMYIKCQDEQAFNMLYQFACQYDYDGMTIYVDDNPGLYEKLSEEQFYAQKEQYKVQTIAWSNLF